MQSIYQNCTVAVHKAIFVWSYGCSAIYWHHRRLKKLLLGMMGSYVGLEDRFCQNPAVMLKAKPDGQIF